VKAIISVCISCVQRTSTGMRAGVWKLRAAITHCLGVISYLVFVLKTAGAYLK